MPLDANLSPDLVLRLGDIYEESEHVYSFGIEASDTKVWEHAKEFGFVIVSKDSDFQQRALVFGPPPKVIWVRLGNCRTPVVESLLRQQSERIKEFVDSDSENFLAIP